MRHLFQPQVLPLASGAALVSALAGYPRLALWLNHPAPIWYLEATIFVCAIVLWGFVFAWHTEYTRQPVFVFKQEPRLFLAATLIGVVTATVFHLWLDPILRSKIPEEYPVDLEHWFAMVLFSLAINQLFLIFAACDWLLRLCKNRWVATSLTALFGTCVLSLKVHSLSTPLTPTLLAVLLTGRLVMGFLAVWFYLRGGVILAWWWSLLFEIRFLPDLIGNS